MGTLSLVSLISISTPLAPISDARFTNSIEFSAKGILSEFLPPALCATMENLALFKTLLEKNRSNVSSISPFDFPSRF